MDRRPVKLEIIRARERLRTEVAAEQLLTAAFVLHVLQQASPVLVRLGTGRTGPSSYEEKERRNQHMHSTTHRTVL